MTSSPFPFQYLASFLQRDGGIFSTRLQSKPEIEFKTKHIPAKSGLPVTLPEPSIACVLHMDIRYLWYSEPPCKAPAPPPWCLITSVEGEESVPKSDGARSRKCAHYFSSHLLLKLMRLEWWPLEWGPLIIEMGSNQRVGQSMTQYGTKSLIMAREYVKLEVCTRTWKRRIRFIYHLINNCLT